MNDLTIPLNSQYNKQDIKEEAKYFENNLKSKMIDHGMNEL